MLEEAGIECMIRIVLNVVEQFIVSLLQQLIEFRQVRLGEAASLASTQERIIVVEVRALKSVEELRISTIYLH